MTALCMTCGAEYPAASAPEVCPICADDRQYVPPGGQRWTELGALHERGHRLSLHEVEPGLHRLSVQPKVGIGQYGYLVVTPDGNVLWDAPAYLDDDAVAAVRAHGPVAAVTTSHPHFYGLMAEWGARLDAPVLVAEADRGWIPRPDPRIVLWSDRRDVLPGVRLVQCGGHFPGSAVVQVDHGGLLTGDTIQVVPHAGWVSFAYSFPNHLPLPAREVRRLADLVGTLEFDRIHAAFGAIQAGGRQALSESAARYIGLLD
jgi:glyoxylase-like metal-dependent hydrolase (beta-lactamase superfamily II)